jgi:hypothetical protein
VALLYRIHVYFGASYDSRFGIFRGSFKMSALLAALAAVPAVEAAKMLSSGAMVAVAVFTAARTTRKR